MCSEGLHGLINKVATNGTICGVSLCCNGPKLTHLLFANDSLIFCRAKEEECQSLLDVLAKYGRAMEQQINRAKTTIVFSKSTTEEVQEVIKDMLGVNVVRQYETFFWGQRGDNRKIHWVKWLDLCKPKTQGGMGFKDLSLFNDALLAKQTWRLLHDTSSLLYRVFKAKFFPNTSVMEAKIPANASYAWKSLMKGRDVIKRGARWRIGLGRSIHIWGDNWLPLKATPKVVSPKVEGSDLTMLVI
ncbi:hypothetical protein SO802_022782 [Lithocarpus litseifolius]|uniref:Reverse transcriptase n=1 Tax=Lithocarpus litseifolius TaxID=425828 RepID=A0AAW2C7Y4_9ROSI